MKLSRLIHLVLCLCIIACMYLCIRFHVLQSENNLNGVIFTEVIFVLIISTVIMQYIISKHMKESTIETMENKMEQFMVQLNRLDHTEDYIHIMMSDILILGRDVNITHVAFPKELTISAQHCRLVYKNNVMYLEDLASTNGTYYKGQRIIHQTPIESGCEIKLANIPFRVTWQSIEKV